MYNKAIYAILAAVFATTLITASIPTPAFSQAENGQSKTLLVCHKAMTGYNHNDNFSKNTEVDHMCISLNEASSIDLTL